MEKYQSISSGMHVLAHMHTGYTCTDGCSVSNVCHVVQLMNLYVWVVTFILMLVCLKVSCNFFFVWNV